MYESSEPAINNETVVIQVLIDERWHDYSRCAPDQAKVFLENRGVEGVAHRFRPTDWITREIIPLEEL